MKKTLLLFILVILGFGVAYLLLTSGLIREKGEVPPEVKLTGYEEALESTPVEVLAGTILAVEEDLIVDIPAILGVSIPGDSPRRTRTVEVSDAAEIFDRIPKNRAQFEREIADYTRKPKSAAGEPPLPYILREIAKFDLKVGDTVMIRAARGVDVRDTPTIEAVEIIRENQ
jgi:hypothetical protein